MNDTIKIKPMKGLKIRCPQSGRYLDPKGETKPRIAYWLRRIADADAEELKK